jgi:CNT family concentrative nucleoside transporter
MTGFFLSLALQASSASFVGLACALNEALGALGHATQAGTRFVCGYLGGGLAPFAVSDPASGFIPAFRALPSLLFYWNVLLWLVRLVSRPPR